MTKYANANSVYSQRMTPIGKTLVFHQSCEEWLDVSESNKISTRYPNHKVDCSEARINGFHRHKVNEVIEQARAKKGRKPAWLKMFKNHKTMEM